MEVIVGPAGVEIMRLAWRVGGRTFDLAVLIMLLIDGGMARKSRALVGIES